MSVILESQAGDSLRIILEVSGSPQGVMPSAQTERTFRVGEQVRFVSFFKRERREPRDENVIDWMVVFDADDGKRYAATQTLFVTEDCWNGLREHFSKKTARKTKPKRQRSRKLVASRG